MIYNTYIRVVILPAHVYMLGYVHPTFPEGTPFRRCPVYVDNKNHKNQRVHVRPCTYKPLLGGVLHVKRNKIYMSRQGVLYIRGDSVHVTYIMYARNYLRCIH